LAVALGIGMAIHYEKVDHVVTICIDRPEARNALDLDHFGQLADSWVRFRDDEDAFVAILTGVSDVYCVGADLKKFISVVTESVEDLVAGGARQQVAGSQYTMAHSLVAVLRDGALLPDGTEFALYKPVIAAINGICAAGGLEMLWNTDLRVMADDTWLQLAEPRRGLFPGGGSTVHSVRQLSWCHAMEVLLLADRITPPRALEMGIVNAVVPRDQVMAKAREWAATIRMNGPLAVRACKESAKKSTFVDLKTALEQEMGYSAQVFMSQDAKEGIAAFREKRKPSWQGR
jgi:enoyl-CoA hydratase